MLEKPCSSNFSVTKWNPRRFKVALLKDPLYYWPFNLKLILQSTDWQIIHEILSRFYRRVKNRLKKPKYIRYEKKTLKNSISNTCAAKITADIEEIFWCLCHILLFASKTKINIFWLFLMIVWFITSGYEVREVHDLPRSSGLACSLG